jgi:hypothetical protein
MALVADRAGGLHLFYPHQPDESSSYGIDYVHWNGSEWSQPVSVLVNPDGSDASHVRAAVDAGQVIHLVWAGGLYRLYYASVPAALAGSVQAWSKPEAIATAITEATIVAGSDGALTVAYADDPDLGRVSLIRSEDGGTTWSSPVPVAFTAPGTVPGEVSLAVDGAGRFHVTWTEHTLPSGSPLTGVFYTRSLDGGLNWESPLLVDGERHGEIGVAAVGDDQVHLVWRSNIGGDGTFHQWSGDGGETWSLPDVYDDRGGMSGLPSFAMDSAGALHYVIGPGFVATWRDGTLGPYVGVAGEELRTGLNQGERWTYPERAVIAITTGNRLHVVFETGFEKLWHTTRLVEAPMLPTVALPTPAATPTSLPREPEPSTQPKPTPTATRAVLSGPFSSASPEPLPAVVVGVAGSAALVLVVVVWQITRRRK